MKVTVTGSSGFIGKNLITYFHKRDIETHELSLRKNDWKNHIDKYGFAIIHLAGKAHDLKKTSADTEYFEVNTMLTIQLFDQFLKSDSEVFIFISSVKAVADVVSGILDENSVPKPVTSYGKSKLEAEKYILSQQLPKNKRVYILRPTMIHGKNNQGNLNLLYQFVSKGIPWPLGAYQNKRSFCNVENLCFVINKLIDNVNIPSGIYNVADDEAISTNQLINIITQVTKKKARILYIPKVLIKALALLGDMVLLPINSERLEKLTENYMVSNQKIKNALQINSLPISTHQGLRNTISSFLK